MNRRYSIREIFMPDGSDMTIFPWYELPPSLQRYWSLQQFNYERQIAIRYSDFLTLEKYDSIEAARENTKELFQSYYNYNLYKYETLINTIGLDYNPIWNVDAEEHIEVEHDTTDTDTIGEVNTTINNGARSTTNTIGPRSTTNTIGARSTTDTFGNQTQTVAEKVAPFETEDIADVPTTSTQTTNANHADTHATQSATDTSATQSTNDTSATLASEDKSKVSSHTNTLTKEGTDTTTVIRKGNIGVTSTQSLIEQERQVALFNIFDIILHDFFDVFCLQILD